MERVLHWTQQRLVWLLVAMYLLGAFAPSFGLGLRELELERVSEEGPFGTVTLPMGMVAVLLFAAGFGVRLQAIGDVVRRPLLLVTGLLANESFPVAFTVLTACLLAAWPSIVDAQDILVGLAMVAAMPIAGASTAWTQSTDRGLEGPDRPNLALSLALVWGSTLVSPLFTPLVLHAVGLVTKGGWSSDLHDVARHGSSLFLVFVVFVPSVLGLALRMFLGRRVTARAVDASKLVVLIDLLLLSYVNASASLPQIIAYPKPDFLALVLVVTVLMCAGAFALGWWLPRRFHGTRGDQTALMFGLGMNNNGLGLVLAQVALPDRPRVLVAIVAYNVVQQLAAGIVYTWRRTAPERGHKVSCPGLPDRTREAH
ncbi:MAG: Na+-dependent transporter [Labilithrix sp.]|nr:Na+-dependent transporter [Labilithrix sp.]